MVESGRNEGGTVVTTSALNCGTQPKDISVAGTASGNTSGVGSETSQTAFVGSEPNTACPGKTTIEQLQFFSQNNFESGSSEGVEYSTV